MTSCFGCCVVVAVGLAVVMLDLRGLSDWPGFARTGRCSRLYPRGSGLGSAVGGSPLRPGARCGSLVSQGSARL